MRKRFFLGIALAAGLATLAAGAVRAQQAPAIRGDQPVVFKADRLRFERAIGLVVATGNVEFAQGDRILLADTVTYNRRTNVVTATGNISLLEPTGEVLFADHVELTGDLKSGIVENLRVRLQDDSRLASAGGRRVGGNRTEFRKAVYSACKPCEENPDRAPVWQVKAVEVVHDQTTHDIEYKDAYIEFLGVPVLYTPYLSHPDPTVKRRSGFLVPSYGSDSELGLILRVPYYFAIAPNMDATVTPIVTTDEGFVGAGEFRHRLSRGEYQAAGSATYASDEDGGDDFRGHLRGKLRYDIDPTWRGGSDLFVTTDDTYLRRYNFSSETTLENRLYVEGFRRRSYAAANGYFFQGLRSSDDQSDTPIVLPMLDYNFVGEPGRHGQQWKVDANVLALTRTNGSNTRRASLKSAWQVPYTSDLGEVYRAYASLQSDVYWIDDIKNPNDTSERISGISGRLFPQAGVDWRLPLARSGGGYTQIVEPRLGFVVAPEGQNSNRIPNEDSLDFEFDDTNLFSENRFGGIDRVEGGPRVNYGLSAAVHGEKGGFSSFFIGQSFRLDRDDDFGRGSGLEEHFSDIVGRVEISPVRHLRALYRFRLDKDSFSPNRNELSASGGIPALRLSVNYLSIDQQEVTDAIDPEDEFRDREEITLALTSQITQNWQTGISTRRDLTPGGGSLVHSALLKYEDDCFQFRVDVSRRFTRDRDVEPTDTIFFRIVLRTLGEFQTATAAN